VSNCTKCGHTEAHHRMLAPQCSAPRCSCLRYVPADSGARVAPIPANLSTPAVRRPTPPPALTVVPPAKEPEVVQGFTVNALVQACARSEHKRTQALGTKLLELADKATAALRAEREAAEAKAKSAEEFAAKKAAVDKLARQLAAAKAELRGIKPTAERAGDPAGEFACDQCDRVFGSSPGRARHVTRTHGGAA
jgi:hypothetical protein